MQYWQVSDKSSKPSVRTVTAAEIWTVEMIFRDRFRNLYLRVSPYQRATGKGALGGGNKVSQEDKGQPGLE